MTVVHSGNVGDILWGLPSVLDLLQRRRASRCRFYLRCNVHAGYGPTLRHPAGQVRMDERMARALIPLLEAQPWIESAKVWDGEPAAVNLDLFRGSGFDYSKGDIATYYQHVLYCRPNLAEPWLTVPDGPQVNGRPLLVCLTWRYRNHNLNYRFLTRYENVLYVGTPEEYETFREQVGNRIPHYRTDDLLKLAQEVKACRGLVCNQTAVAAIADGLKVPRVLEVSPGCPNVHWHGPGGYHAWRQDLLERAVADLG